MSSGEGTVEVEALAGVREVLEFTAPGRVEEVAVGWGLRTLTVTDEGTPWWGPARKTDEDTPAGPTLEIGAAVVELAEVIAPWGLGRLRHLPC